jgi:acyl-CoA thioester hydrolase
MRNKVRLQPVSLDGAFIFPARVYYEDTDAAGVVYYANHLRFCERARTEWLRHLGFEQHDMLSALRVAFVVRSVQAEYLAPARLDDLLTIATRVTEIGRASLDFAQSILRGGELLFDSRITVACIDTALGRPLAIPAALRALLPEPPDQK